MKEPKEKPILFSTSMVQALLDGRKTQTRRIMKPQPPHSCHYAINASNSAALCLATGAWEAKEYDRCFVPPTPKSKDHLLPCPYGKPGDLLWVKETTYADYESHDAVTLAKYLADHSQVVYGGDAIDEHGEDSYGGTCAHWWVNNRPTCPSIHMPKKFSRIWLEVESVRVERLQDISEEDAIAEGVEPFDDYWKDYIPNQDFQFTAWDSFRTLWQSINGQESWDVNPWVWVVQFKVLSTAGKPQNL